MGDAFTVQFYTDAALTTAQAIHAANRWELDKRDIPSVNPLALVSNTDRWPKAKLPADTVYTADLPVGTMVLNETFPGFQLTTTSANRFSAAPSYFSPTVDLDDHAHGEFHCSLELTIAPTSDVNMGFVQGKSNQTADDRNRALSNIVFASDVAEESAWVASTTLPINGLSLFRQTVYSGSTIVGHYNILMVKNSSNATGVYYYWDGQAGSTGATLTAELRVSFFPSDTPSSIVNLSLVYYSQDGRVTLTNITVPTYKELMLGTMEIERTDVTEINRIISFIVPLAVLRANRLAPAATTVTSSNGYRVAYETTGQHESLFVGLRADDRLIVGGTVNVKDLKVFLL